MQVFWSRVEKRDPTGLWVGILLLSCVIAAWFPRLGDAALIAVLNQSSVTSTSDTEFRAALGGELRVTGRVGDRTTTGERLIEAYLQVIVTKADGTVVWTAEYGPPLTPGAGLDFRLLVQPAGVLDGSLISRVILRDLKVDTVERQERETRRLAEEARVAEAARLNEVRAAEQTLAEEKRIAERRERLQIEAERQAKVRREREREVAIKARGWPADMTRAVIDRTVVLGMTQEQVSMAWGRPGRINETVQASGVREQWVYSIYRYVYFHNGRVTAIQNTRE